MITYFVHDPLNRKTPVTAYYNLDEAERNVTQWGHVVQDYARPVVLEAYQASIERFSDFYKKLAG